jgi:small subunit ribosomal protein S5
MEMAGISNIISKSLGSGNPTNMVKATLEGLHRLEVPEDVMRGREARSGEEASHVGA